MADAVYSLCRVAQSSAVSPAFGTVCNHFRCLVGGLFYLRFVSPANHSVSPAIAKRNFAGPDYQHPHRHHLLLLFAGFWHRPADQLVYLSNRFFRSNRRLADTGSALFASPAGDELKEEFKSNDRYDIKVVAASEAESLVNDNLMVIFNPYDREGPVNRQSLYRLIFAGVTFINVHDLYEEIFERIPVSILDEQWFIENISSRGAVTYDLFKRAMDIAVSLVLGLISLVFYPFIILAIKIEDGNEIFTHQNRAGRNNQIIQVVKFRTMLFTDNGDWQNQDKVNRVTKVGNFLRRTRLDELPQLWNVLRGDVSLIGPRPEFPKAVEHYADKIPYYNIRHLIKPGLSGWAQIYGEHPHHGLEIETTQNKLSHDLYYVKHRGIILDIIIGLKTIRTLLSRSGI